MFHVVWDYYSLKLKGKQYKQNISPKSYKTEIKIFANPSLIGLWTTRPCSLNLLLGDVLVAVAVANFRFLNGRCHFKGRCHN